MNILYKRFNNVIYPELFNTTLSACVLQKLLLAIVILTNSPRIRTFIKRLKLSVFQFSFLNSNFFFLEVTISTIHDITRINEAQTHTLTYVIICENKIIECNHMYQCCVNIKH